MEPAVEDETEEFGGAEKEVIDAMREERVETGTAAIFWMYFGGGGGGGGERRNGWDNHSSSMKPDVQCSTTQTEAKGA